MIYFVHVALSSNARVTHFPNWPKAYWPVPRVETPSRVQYVFPEKTHGSEKQRLRSSNGRTDLYDFSRLGLGKCPRSSVSPSSGSYNSPQPVPLTPFRHPSHSCMSALAVIVDDTDEERVIYLGKWLGVTTGNKNVYNGTASLTEAPGRARMSFVGTWLECYSP